MKTTNQNSHTHTHKHTEERNKKLVWQGHHNSFRQLLWARICFLKLKLKLIKIKILPNIFIVILHRDFSP